MNRSTSPKGSIYVAGSSREMERVQHAIAGARWAGLEATSTWIESVRRVGRANPRDASTADRARWARQCLAEVAVSDLVWVLVPGRGSQTIGAWWEASAALAAGIPLVLSGDTRQSVFCALGHEVHGYDHAAIQVILEILYGVRRGRVERMRALDDLVASADDEIRQTFGVDVGPAGHDFVFESLSTDGRGSIALRGRRRSAKAQRELDALTLYKGEARQTPEDGEPIGPRQLM